MPGHDNSDDDSDGAGGGGDESAGQAASAPRLTVTRRGDPPATLLALSGILDERFDPGGVEAPRGGVVLVDCGGIREVTDAGAERWQELIAALARGAEVGLVECPRPVVARLNDPALVGPARLFSLRVPYRCDYCDEERPRLLRVDRDGEALESGRPPDRPCETCGEATYFDEEPGYLAFAARCPPLALSGPAAALLSRELEYDVDAPARAIEIRKQVRGRVTRIEVAGDLGAAFPAKKLADGLVGPIIIDVAGVGAIDPAGAAAWRNFLQLATPGAEAIYLAGVPPLFLEKLARPEDLGPKRQIVSLAVPYLCRHCERSRAQAIDVAACHEDLALGRLPERRCPHCRRRVRADVTESLVPHLLQLLPTALSDEVRAVLAGRDPPLARPRGRRRSRGRVFGVGVAAAVAAIAAGTALFLIHRRAPQSGAGAAQGVGALVARSGPRRPSWIRHLTPLSAVCRQGALGLTCVGASSYASDREDAREQASAAALEALAQAVAQRVAAPGWTVDVAQVYTGTRRSRLAAFGRARAHPNRASYRRALFDLRRGRMLVADSFRKTGGTGVPVTPRNIYWERYRAADGQGDRYLSFVEHELAPAQVSYLVELYTRRYSAGGVTAITMFPELAWRYPDVSTGAVVVGVDPHGALAPLELRRGDILLSLDGRTVVDAGDFATAVTRALSALRKTGGSLRVLLQPRAGAQAERRLEIPAPRPPDAGAPPAAAARPR